jgi:rfaE bifunctional protein nucleotidyltransferase chain/domain
MERLPYIQQKTLALTEAKRRVESWKLKDDKIVFTNGCFDILHKGHVTYLAQAAELGNRLVVGLNTDESVKRQGKGTDRPINDQEARAAVLSALGFVDMVILFDAETPLELIQELLPDALAKGADYDASETDSTSTKYIVGSDVVRKNGGTIHAIDMVAGFSTTGLIDKLKKA